MKYLHVKTAVVELMLKALNLKAVNRKAVNLKAVNITASKVTATNKSRSLVFLLTTIVGVTSLNTHAQSVLNLSKDSATPIALEEVIDTVFISDPEIADYKVISENKIVVFGRKVGSVSLIVFGKKSKVLLNKTLVVNKSLAHIQQQIDVRYPKLVIDLLNVGDQVVLTGKVASHQQKEQIYTLVGELLNKEYTEKTLTWDLGPEAQSLEIEFMQRRTYKGLVNNLELGVTKQVNVKLTVAEVSHSFIEQLGFEYGSVTVDGSIRGNGLFGDMLKGFSTDNVAAFINAINDESTGQILAEPNLSVISGETASFLVGGEMPIVTYLDDKYQVSYKEFGVRLELAAKVLQDDRISLALMPEVSSVDTSFSDETLNIPAFKTRRARTTVELADGESFILAGLLNTEDIESIAKIPFLGDIPGLGALFRNVGTERRKTELIIVATVNLVEPISPSLVQLPSMQRTTTLTRFFNIATNDAADKRESKSESQQWAEKIINTGGFKQ